MRRAAATYRIDKLIGRPRRRSITRIRSALSGSSYVSASPEKPNSSASTCVRRAAARCIDNAGTYPVEPRCNVRKHVLIWANVDLVDRVAPARARPVSSRLSMHSKMVFALVCAKGVGLQLLSVSHTDTDPDAVIPDAPLASPVSAIRSSSNYREHAQSSSFPSLSFNGLARLRDARGPFSDWFQCYHSGQHYGPHCPVPNTHAPSCEFPHQTTFQSVAEQGRTSPQTLIRVLLKRMPTAS
ncbi:unnamed protein product [Acanthosepion pharaonis]|uniref:Uncharacterized protein n=1 Tax=Acanthosepion pharaonis TaxID=158019 RepID=A0A812DJ74_ACAPH|nr:unnamed protein product [Sepia pharaonis]